MNDASEMTFKVSGMTCGHCKETVGAAVKAVDGVTGVEVDLSSGTLRVSGTNESAIREAIETSGYAVDGK